MPYWIISQHREVADIYCDLTYRSISLCPSTPDRGFQNAVCKRKIKNNFFNCKKIPLF